MKVYIANDHAINMADKTKIIDFIKSLNHEVIDCGPQNDESVDYPDYGRKCAENVIKDAGSVGVLICGTGIGISLAANKVKGIRCALAPSVEYAELSRQHNNANMISLGARFTSLNDMNEIIKKFLETDFEGGRHQRRVNKIEEDK